MSVWSEWSACSAACGEGQHTRTGEGRQSRTRAVEVAAAFGGTACPKEWAEFKTCVGEKLPRVPALFLPETITTTCNMDGKLQVKSSGTVVSRQSSSGYCGVLLSRPSIDDDGSMTVTFQNPSPGHGYPLSSRNCLGWALPTIKLDTFDYQGYWICGDGEIWGGRAGGTSHVSRLGEVFADGKTLSIRFHPGNIWEPWGSGVIDARFNNNPWKTIWRGTPTGLVPAVVIGRGGESNFWGTEETQYQSIC
jgi:hypothetical protein